MTLNVQFLTMMSMVAGGFYLGIMLDTFRRLTRSWTSHFIVTTIVEVCFWLIQTFILFYILFLVNGGELRAYVFIACLLGFSAYQVVGKRWYMKLLERILSVVAAIYRFIAHLVRVMIVLPIIYIFRFVITCLFLCIHVIVWFIGIVLKIILFPFTRVLKKVYSWLPKCIQVKLRKIKGFYSTIENIYVRCREFMMFMRR